MRLAVVDVGNTSTAAGLWVNGRVSRVVHIDGSIDEAFVAVSQICDLGVDALAYVSVVPKRDSKWRAFAKREGLEFRRKGESSFHLFYPYLKKRNRF